MRFPGDIDALNWAEDPLPTPSTPIDQPLRTGDRVCYYRTAFVGARPKRIEGTIERLLGAREIALVSGHRGTFDVQMVPTSKLTRVRR